MASDKTAKAPETNPYAVTFGAPPPPVQRIGGGGNAGPLHAAMQSMPTPGKEGVPQFFAPADPAPSTITDPGEQSKAVKENARKLSNKLSGMARRITKQDEDTGAKPVRKYALRTLTHNGALGVMVYRTA